MVRVSITSDELHDLTRSLVTNDDLYAYFSGTQEGKQEKGRKAPRTKKQHKEDET